MLCRTITIAALLSAVAGAAAQDVPIPEVRPFVGVFVPTGAHQSDFRTASTIGMQGALEVSENIHALTSVAWTYGHTKSSGSLTDVTYIWHFDVGAEFNAVRKLARDRQLRPFVGLGAGARSYDYKAAELGSSSCGTVYGSLGSELQTRAIAFRLEARGYGTCFKSPVTAEVESRSDVEFSIGLAYHLR